MSQLQIFSDWKKQASQISSRNTNKDQQEQAFMNLAYGYVSQKAGKLMEDPHRLGFEIVYANEDSSKMAGMFAFRVGRTLISVPAIFINNDVKGTELMYEHATKLVRPLSVEWADHLISKYHDREATPQDPGTTGKMISGMQLDRIANPRMFKMSSAWENVFEELEAKPDSLPDILPECLLDGGPRIMQKLARAIDLSWPFANALAALPEEVYLPTAIYKEAAAPIPATELITRHFPMTKMASEDHDKAQERGWFLWENRPEHDLKPVTVDTEELVSEITEPGLYDVILDSGESARAYVLSAGENNSPRDTAAGMTAHGSTSKMLVFEDGTVSNSYHVIWGSLAEGDDGNTWRWSESGLPDKPSTGKTYFALPAEGGNAHGPYKIESVKTREDGVTVLQACGKYCSSAKTHYINPEFNGIQLGDGADVFGDGVVWLEVKTEKSEYGDGYQLKDSKKRAGSKEHLMTFLGKNSIRKITVEKEPDGPGITVKEGDEPVFDDTDVAQCCKKMASCFDISAQSAMDIVDRLAHTNHVEFWVEGLTKTAAQMQDTMMQLINSPNYQRGYDSDLRVETEQPQDWALDTAVNQPVPGPRRYGDAYDPTMGTSAGNQDSQSRYISEEAMAAGITDDDIFDQDPDQIAQMYTESNVPNLFQHGTVGMLVSTYDSANMIQKYLPKLEEGLDHFGRILFLFYWKPQDFEKLYGADDLANLEQELLSQFKSFGDVLLQLIKKNEIKTGSVPTP